MKHITVMLKPSSSLCNLRCRYCFYADVSENREVSSFGLMQRETAKKIIGNLFSCTESGDTVTLAFQGGEPTLIGLDFYRFFVEESEKLRNNACVTYSIQTNGTLLNEEWCSFFREHRFLVGLSLDGMQAIHDENRLDTDGKGTYARAMATKALLGKHCVEYNILTVLTNSLARHPQQVWNWLCKENIRYAQFIPCLSKLGGSTSSFSLKPERFAFFYTQLFKQWQADFQQGHYRSIKLFDDLVNFLIDGSRNACGLTGQCMPQIVVEADGSVYPCDFYALDEYRVGNLSDTPVAELYEKAIMMDFHTRPTEKLSLCEDCPYMPICGGGCPRMRREVCGVSGNKLCGYRSFLNTCFAQLQAIALQEHRARLSNYGRN